MNENKYFVREVWIGFDQDENDRFDYYITHYDDEGIEVLEDGSPIGNVSDSQDPVIEICNSLEEANAYINSLQCQ